MKTWDCIRSIYQGIRVPCILLTGIMTAALFITTVAFGHYRYFTFSRDGFQNAGLEKAYYVTHFGSIKPGQEEIEQEIAKTRGLPGVKRCCMIQPFLGSFIRERDGALPCYRRKYVRHFP